MVQRCWWIVAIVLGGCFSPKFQDAQLTCGPNDLCPPGLTCGDDGLCHEGAFTRRDAGGDTTRPAAPTLSAVSPSSPANNNNPTVTGNAEAGTTVKLYGDTACTQELASGTAAELASPGIAVPVGDNSTTTFAATATDTAGNASLCSTTIMYVEDSAAPAAPALASTIPASPSRSVVPSVIGTGEAGTTILVFSNGTCSGTSIGMGVADVDGDFSVTSTVSAAVVNTLSALARDAAGNMSPCSMTLNYEQIASAVGVPTLGATVPPSPSSTVTNPMVSGTAEPGVTVRLFAEPSCSGTPLATGPASPGGTYAISVTVSVNSTTTYYAQAFDSAVNQFSQCSAVTLVYTHDSQPPLAPLVSTTTPTSPSNSTMPSVSGTAEPSSTILLFTDIGCTGTELVSTTVAMNGTYAVLAPTSADATFYAKARDAAGNLSVCSTGLLYDYDATPPGPPAIVETFPASPSSSDNTPIISGMADPFTTIRVYETADCTGTEAGSVTLGNTMGFGIGITVPSNSITPVTATATDAAGNTSGCSSAMTYVHDSLPPAAPVIMATNPTSPANGNSPMVSGTAEMGTTVQLYTNSTCTNTIGAAVVATAGTFNIPISVTNDTTTTLYTKATDTTLNASPCSSQAFSFTEDSTPPNAPSLNSVAPSSTDLTPTLTGSAEAGSTVHIYRTADCSDMAMIMTSAVSGAFSADATVTANSQTAFSARALDSANNASACSTSFTYIHDNTNPAAPTGLASTPTSPAPSSNPTITGMAEANGTVRLFKFFDCSGPIAGTTTAAGGGTFSIPLTVSNGSTTTFFANVADAAGNVSTCSTASVTYTEDSELPAAPINLATTPGSPAPSLAPAFTGNAEASATVKLYTNSTCTGAALYMGAASGAGAFSIPTTVTAGQTLVLWATATDSAGNASACSATSASYTQDSVMPGGPVFTSAVPGSPANNTNPSINGTAETGSTVKLWSTSNCMTTMIGQGPATGGSFSIGITVGDNSTNTIYANATDAANNVSGCVNLATYIEDSIAPPVPTGLATTPVSPRNNNAPSVTGTSELGATITVYTTSDCTGAVAGSAIAGALGAFSVPVAVANNSTTTFYAKASDAANNTSACSTSNVIFIEDSIVPTTPVITATVPASPSNDETPVVNGSGENASTVRIFTTSNCSTGQVGTGAVSGGTFSITLTTPVTENLTTALYASAIDAALNVSGCSLAFAFQEDSVAPALPATLATNPVSPANANSPTITGSAEAGSTVRAYSDSGCAIQAGTDTTASPGGTFGIAVSVGNNTTTTFYLRATDAATNVSACSMTASIVYVEDSTAIETPVITGSTPTSPSKTSTTPTLTGTAVTGLTVNLYTSATCMGPAVATGTAAASAFSIANVPAATNNTTVFYASATNGVNTSGCSAGFSYTHDSAVPVAPTGLAATPVGPANNNQPTITGSAEAASTVRLFNNAACTLPSGGMGSGFATGGSFSIQVLPAMISDGSSTTIYANATDAATNTSGCSTVFVTYVEDSTPPATPTVTGTTPPSPSNTSTTPTVSGAAETGSTVNVYSTPTCTGSPLASAIATTGNVYSVPNVSVAANSSTTFRVTATDPAGNTSACSATSVIYTHDNQAPATPTAFVITPIGPANNNNPVASGTADTGSSVGIYTNSACTGTPAFSATASGGAFTIPLTVTNDTTTTFYAKATDAATNGSGCTTGISYTEDSTAPAAPTFSGSTPTSPSMTVSNPTINGNAAAGSTVGLFTNSTCTGSPITSGTASGAGTFAIPVTVTANTPVTYWAKATDVALNGSACSSGAPTGSLTYLYDTSPPNTPVPSGTTPSTRANDNSPEINGTAEAGATVAVYTSGTCTIGTEVATGIATGGNFSVTVNVSDNTVTNMFVRAIDPAGNPSACTVTAVTYTEDSAPPGIPTVSSTNPPSPSNNNNPNVLGSTNETGATINIYSNNTCTSSVLGTGTSTTGGAFTIGTTLATGTSYTLYATATDAYNNTSACSTTSVAYVEDSTAPATPSGIGSSPTSPANDNTPELTGNAESGATVKVYTNSACTGAEVASGPSTGTFSITVNVTNDTSTTYYLTATDAANNASACSAGYLYREDSTANAPVLSSTTPASPAGGANTSPTINGTGEANATIKFFNGAVCGGAQVASGTISAGGTFAISVSVTANTSTQFSAYITDLASNQSACSTPITYVHDNTPPTMLAPTSAVATAFDKILVSWASGSDNLTLVANLRYDICWSLTIGGSCAGTATTLGGATSHSITGLTASTRYYITVRAVDQIGNASAYQGPVSDRTLGAGSIIQIAAGNDYSCALVADGTVWCWGANAQGQLGDGSNTQRATPVEVSGLVDVIQIAAGGTAVLGSHVCALKADGTVWCWGNGTYGQLGNAASVASNVPVQVSGITNAKGVAAGMVHTCATLTNGTIKCWGLGAQGQLGNAASSNSNVPVVVSSITTAVQVDLGAYHTCAVLADGSARCWGSGANGRLGHGLTSGSNTPVTVSLLAVDKAKSIDVGNYHTCVVTHLGGARCWGGNLSGQLGNNTTTDSSTPVTVTLSGGAAIAAVISVSAGGSYLTNTTTYHGSTCLVISNGGMYCLGYNATGQLADGTTTNKLVATLTNPNQVDVVQASVGQDHTCYLQGNGTAKCVGSGANYRLGNNSLNNWASFVSVANLYAPERTVSIRGNHGGFNNAGNSSCALISNGTVTCFGSGTEGQMGNGDGINSFVPATPVENSSNQVITNAKQIAVGERHACLLRADGTVWCWGNNAQGQVGNNTLTTQLTAVNVTNNTIAISAGHVHTCALRYDGNVYCWGDDAYGNLGNGAGGDTLVPGLVSTITEVRKINAHGFGACAIMNDGAVQCWGWNGNGGLGDTTTTTRQTPVAYSGAANAIDLGASRWTNCVVAAAGTATCAGNSGSGQLGNGTTGTTNATPVAVTGTDFVSMGNGGEYHHCALGVGGLLRCWGYNGQGQLGLNDTTQRTTPTTLTAIDTVKDFGAARQHTCALLADGTAQCFGYGTLGSLGDNNTSNHFSLVPAPVLYLP